MPLHIDRSTISLDHAQRREWAIERAPRETPAAPAGEAPRTDADAVSVAGLGASSHDVELEHVEQAEQLVRQLLDRGTGLRGLHAGVDPTRVQQLISD